MVELSGAVSMPGEKYEGGLRGEVKNIIYRFFLNDDARAGIYEWQVTVVDRPS